MPRRRRIALAAAIAAAVAAGGAFMTALATPWSRSCGEETRDAAAAWARYGAQLDDPEARMAAAAVAALTETDLASALERAEQVAPPPAEASSAYREAMERITLADGACLTGSLSVEPP